jgi:hypothetical protein
LKRTCLALAFATFGCGYHALYAAPAGERLHVSLARVAIANGAAGEEVARGAREELARQGALAAGSGYPALEIEVTGASESSEGIEVSAAGRAPGARVFDQTPTARATSVAIVARACVVRASGADPERDTGDMRVEDLVGADAVDPVSAGFVYEDAQRAAGHRLGRKLAARILGDPSVSEGLGR